MNESRRGERREEGGEGGGKERGKETFIASPASCRDHNQHNTHGTSIAGLEPRFTHRVRRSLTALRKWTDSKVLRDGIEEEPYPVGVFPGVGSSMNGDANPDSTPPSPPRAGPLPEVEGYLRLLILHYLHAAKGTYAKSIELSHKTAENDPIAAKVWFAVERSHELGGELATVRPQVPILLNPRAICNPLYVFRMPAVAQRIASFRHDDDTQVSLINLLLRNHLHSTTTCMTKRTKTTFPASAGNPDLLTITTPSAQATRGAPRAKTARSFYQAMHKLFVIAEMVKKHIPLGALSDIQYLKKALNAYFDILKVVHPGSLSEFQSTLNKHAAQFDANKTYTPFVRFRQDIIKTGIRKLYLPYSRISLRHA
ncbi:hypothetical protein BJ138DRAFT_1231064 [Hygrophoropsis aurantiaca]|uniref:Uncharacterized protein n=1 Tax=Hygrophoropsis aurantiaca TaxID=72124 RepID=A0ACB7ZWV2_9AGAM|nr:hypothetical protein BJ138DRAFT_1231064 [Hygrophoropsis aurantiaca]